MRGTDQPIAIMLIFEEVTQEILLGLKLNYVKQSLSFNSKHYSFSYSPVYVIVLVFMCLKM